ncbi:hypothetical protein [Massilia sp. YMA4]|uniref:hypothetical protein n=1 Tax=Massilia sp. YMA4 TaxID=1593482 RepID=UPI000DD17F16|nr:hypothetical protein [Massilia sp. YMA4]AXA94170.1 hypothetical protein DPH57_25375 [Massilia sp. YMA4]
MLRRTALLSALTLSLLLAACGKKHEEAVDDSVAAENAEAQATEAPVEEPKPEPKADYWQFVGPLVAGTYEGECVRLPDARKMDATIKVGADGKVSSSGLEVDLHTAKTIMMMRSRDDKGQYSTVATLAVDEGQGGTLSLQSGKENGASLGKGETGIACTTVTANRNLNARPLYQSVAKLLEGRKQTIGCLDTKNLLVRRKLDFAFDNGVVKIGDASFDLKDAVGEGFTVNDDGKNVGLIVEMPAKRTLNVLFDGAGNVTLLQAHNDQESTHHCMVES